MTEQMPPQTLSPFQRLLKEHFLRGVEVRGEKEAYRLTVPGRRIAKENPNAGISVGWAQRDLAHAPDDLKKVVEFLGRDPVLATLRKDLSDILGRKAAGLADADREFLNTHR